MTFIEILLLAVSLSVDTLVVSIGSSVTQGKIAALKIGYAAVVFGLMQTAFLFIGWVLGHSVVAQVLGHSVVAHIDKFAPVIGFLLLLYVGLTMIVNALRKNEGNKVDIAGMKSLLVASVATSVDASAVGVSLAMTEIALANMYLILTVVFAVTVIAAVCGVISGSAIGRKFGKPARISGGIVLIGIGIRILLG